MALPNPFRSFSTFESLRVRDYRLLWLGQVSTSMGQWMDQVTRGWLIYQITGSALQLGLATALRGLPLLFFGILAGAVADRSSRKTQLILAQVTNAMLNAILATLVLLHQVQPWHIYVTGFLAGTVQAFQQPARQTLISDIVGDQQLLNALALNATALNVSRASGQPSPVLIAPSASRLLLLPGGHVRRGNALDHADARVPSRTSDRLASASTLLREHRRGLRFVAQERNIRSLMMLALGPLTFAMSYTSLMPVMARSRPERRARTQGLILVLHRGRVARWGARRRFDEANQATGCRWSSGPHCSARASSLCLVAVRSGCPAGSGCWSARSTSTYTDPEPDAAPVELGYPPHSPYLALMRGLRMPPQTLLLRRMEVQLLALLGGPPAAADWGAIAAEHHAGAPASIRSAARTTRSTPGARADSRPQPARRTRCAGSVE